MTEPRCDGFSTCPRPCMECQGQVHHFDETLAGTAEGDPEHPAAKLGIAVWWQCKHCDAWLEYDNGSDDEGLPLTACFAKRPPPPPKKQRQKKQARPTLLGDAQVHPAAMCGCGHRADSHYPELPSPCGHGRTMTAEEIMARCGDQTLTSDPRYGCRCTAFHYDQSRLREVVDAKAAQFAEDIIGQALTVASGPLAGSDPERSPLAEEQLDAQAHDLLARLGVIAELGGDDIAIVNAVKTAFLRVSRVVSEALSRTGLSEEQMLDVVEHAFLTSGRWRESPRPGFWIDTDGCDWPKVSAIQIERDRRAYRGETGPVDPTRKPASWTTFTEEQVRTLVKSTIEAKCAQGMADMRVCIAQHELTCAIAAALLQRMGERPTLIEERTWQDLQTLRAEVARFDEAMTRYGFQHGFQARAYDETGLCAARAALLRASRGETGPLPALALPPDARDATGALFSLLTEIARAIHARETIPTVRAEQLMTIAGQWKDAMGSVFLASAPSSRASEERASPEEQAEIDNERRRLAAEQQEHEQRVQAEVDAPLPHDL